MEDRRPPRPRPRVAVIAAALIALHGISASAQAQDAFQPFAGLFEGGLSENSANEPEEHIETDRDSFTPATTLVNRGWTMVESSYSFVDNRDADDKHSLPELLIRIGITDWIELRVGGNFETGGGGEISGSQVGGEDEGTGRETESNVLYGLKIAVSEQQDWLPRSALIVHATTPTSGSESATQFVTGYVAGWTLPNGWDVDSSLRYVSASEEGDHFNQWAPSCVLKAPLGEHWNTHIEYFGLFSDGRADDRNPQYISPGLHYLVTKNWEVGLRVGWGLNHDAANFFSNVGLGVQF